MFRSLIKKKTLVCKETIVLIKLQNKDDNLKNEYRVIKKKTNQECYLIFCLFEMSVLAYSRHMCTCYTPSFYWLPTSRKIHY
jgi:hypothetical protein